MTSTGETIDQALTALGPNATYDQLKGWLRQKGMKNSPSEGYFYLRRRKFWKSRQSINGQGSEQTVRVNGWTPTGLTIDNIVQFRKLVRDLGGTAVARQLLDALE